MICPPSSVGGAGLLLLENTTQMAHVEGKDEFIAHCGH